MGVFTGASSVGEGVDSDSVLANSPVAISSDVRPSSGSFVELENQPPGKKREEVVDSWRVRAVDGDTSAGAVDETISTICSFSSTGARRPRLGLFNNHEDFHSQINKRETYLAAILGSSVEGNS